jgi:hypothetical protein
MMFPPVTVRFPPEIFNEVRTPKEVILGCAAVDRVPETVPAKVAPLET